MEEDDLVDLSNVLLLLLLWFVASIQFQKFDY